MRRLLSLDKSFDSFQERLQEAARILDISLDPQFISGSSTSSSLSHISRLDFVLRWLLDKLSAQQETCQYLPSWILFRRILERMPTAALAKSLSVASPVNTCSSALAHLFPPTSTPAPNIADDAKPSTKKRKRQSAANDTTSDHPALIFAQVTVAIRVLISRSTQSRDASDAASENRVHALLRLDHADLVRFVKHTLYALLHLRTSHSLPLSHVAATLTLIQDLAILQPNASVDSMDISFCTECLWPAALLLQSLHSELGSVNASQHNATRSLDRLLATHLFVPARVAFYTSKATVPKKRQQSEVPGLVQRLEPLRAHITALVDGDTSDPVKQGQLLHAYACVPLLLDLAVRCAPIGNPKQRIVEAPWIHLLFNSLSETITKAPDAIVVNQKLNEMFDVLSDNKLVLDADALGEILDQRCNLSTSTPDFPLVAKILNMNASIFTDVNAAPAKALFDTLTRNGEAKTSAVSGLVSNNDWSNPRNICYEIVVPLMHAYARTRNLPAFIDQWSACLSVQIASKKSSRWFLWADLSLEESLRDILETSLTSAQISELLESRQSALSQSVALSSVASPQAFANIVLLNAIIGALKTDATIDALMPYLESLLLAVESAFLQTGDIDELLCAHMIGLCSRIYQLWYPIWSTTKSGEEVRTRNARVLGGPITHLALKKIQSGSKSKSGTILEVDSAFVFIASICDMQRKLIGHESDYAHLFCRAALPSKDGKKSSSYASQRPVAFLTIITGFPGLLTCIPATERGQLFKDLFDSFFSDHSYSKSVLFDFLDAVFAASDLATKDDLFNVVCEAIENSTTSKSWLDLLLQWPLKGFSRQQRENILDLTVSAVTQKNFDSQSKQQALDLIRALLELPNATAKISVAPGVLWDLAGISYNSTELDAFESVCQRLLGHILDTKEQDRSKSYLEQLSALASKFIGKHKDLGLPSNPGRVSLVKVLFESFEARYAHEDMSSFPHCSSSTIDSLLKRLWEILSSSTDDELSGSNLEKARVAVQVYTGIPESILASGGSSTEKCKCLQIIDECGSGN